MKKIVIIMIFLLIITGCKDASNKNLKLKIGDYINYDAGNWTEEEINLTVIKERANEQGEFSLFQVNVGDSKNLSIIKGCYKDNNKTENKGWRVISIKNEKITIIHAGVPVCYYHMLTLDDTYQKESIVNLNKFANTHFVNEQYAESARSVICEDFFKVKCMYGSGNFTEENLISEIYNDSTMYNVGDNYWLASPSNIYRLWDWNQDYKGFSNHDTHPYGLRPVVTLKADIVLDGTGDGSQNNPYGIKVR